MLLVSLPCALSTLLFIIVASLVINHNSEHRTYSDTVWYQEGYLTQVLEDWKTKPLTDVLVIKVDESYPMMPTYCPKEYPEQVVYKFWPGTFPYCDCSLWMRS